MTGCPSTCVHFGVLYTYNTSIRSRLPPFPSALLSCSHAALHFSVCAGTKLLHHQHYGRLAEPQESSEK